MLLSHALKQNSPPPTKLQYNQRLTMETRSKNRRCLNVLAPIIDLDVSSVACSRRQVVREYKATQWVSSLKENIYYGDTASHKE
jgi:hypothetical protein